MNGTTTSVVKLSSDEQIDLRKQAQNSIVDGSNEKCIRIFRRLNALKVNELNIGMPVSEVARLQRGLVYRVFNNLEEASNNQEKRDPGDFAFLVKEWPSFFIENHDMYTFAIEGFLLCRPYDIDELYATKKVHSNLKPIFSKNPSEKRVYRGRLDTLKRLISEREREIKHFRKGY